VQQHSGVHMSTANIFLENIVRYLFIMNLASGFCNVNIQHMIAAAIGEVA